MDKTMGDRIKAKRLEKGMTQEELGDKVGVKGAAVNKWETGLVDNIPSNRIAQIADVLGTTPIYLLCGNENFSERDSYMKLNTYWEKLNSIVKNMDDKQLERVYEYASFVLNNKQDK